MSGLPFGGSTKFHSGGHQWPTNGPIGYITPSVWHGPHRFTTGNKLRRGPWSSSGTIGYITRAVWGVPNALEVGTKSVVGHN